MESIWINPGKVKTLLLMKDEGAVADFAVLLEVEDPALVRINLRCPSMRFQYFSLPLHLV